MSYSEKKPAVDLGKPPKLAAGAHNYRILALSGGGYRGLFTARILAGLEKQAKRPLNQVFDLIAGTSIGGILAAGLAVGISARTLADALEDRGKSIFPSGLLSPVRQLVTSKYSNHTLQQAIKEILLKDYKRYLSDIDSSLLITSVSYSLAAPRIYRSKGMVGEKAADDVRLLDTLMATSAAPTYFPPHTMDGHILIDGGLIANAPDLLALTQTLLHTKHKLDNCWMLSVGTVSPDLAQAAIDSPTKMGTLKWMTTKKLFQVTMAAQERLAVNETQALLPNRYLRIDPRPSSKQAKAIALDKADKKATQTLNMLAESAIDDVTKKQSALLQNLLH